MKSSSLQAPAIGDVIRYAYLWSHEHDSGREDGLKDRPAAVVALVQMADGATHVIVFPITSARPDDPTAGVLLPTATRARLGLQPEPCWVLVSEANRFAWPGPDLRRDTVGGDVTYGSLPKQVLDAVKRAFAARREGAGTRVIRRTE